MQHFLKCVICCCILIHGTAVADDYAISCKCMVNYFVENA